MVAGKHRHAQICTGGLCSEKPTGARLTADCTHYSYYIKKYIYIYVLIPTNQLYKVLVENPVQSVQSAGSVALLGVALHRPDCARPCNPVQYPATTIIFGSNRRLTP